MSRAVQGHHPATSVFVPRGTAGPIGRGARAIPVCAGSPTAPPPCLCPCHDYIKFHYLNTLPAFPQVQRAADSWVARGRCWTHIEVLSELTRNAHSQTPPPNPHPPTDLLRQSLWDRGPGDLSTVSICGSYVRWSLKTDAPQRGLWWAHGQEVPCLPRQAPASPPAALLGLARLTPCCLQGLCTPIPPPDRPAPPSRAGGHQPHGILPFQPR